MSVRVEQRGWWRRRGAGVVLALAVELLLLLALLTLVPRPAPRFKGAAEKSFELANVDADEAPATKSRSRVQPHAKAAERPADRPAPVPPPPPAREPPAPEPLGDIPGLLRLSRADLAAGDIGKIKRAPGPSPGADATQLADADGSGDSQPIGTAPNGEPLYPAEWFRRPRDAELSPYIAKARAAAGGWGLIACQTAPRNRVENCQILGESPAGSSLGLQVREAAWQFQVLPPRKGGKPLIGAWVQILIKLREG